MGETTYIQTLSSNDVLLSLLMDCVWNKSEVLCFCCIQKML